MKRPIISKLLSVLVNLGTFFVLLGVISSLNNLHQSGDNFAFLFWTLPLAIALGILGESMLSIIQKSGNRSKLFLILAYAIIFSLLWFYVFFRLWDNVGSPFVFQPFYCWIAGSFMQLLFLEKRLPKATAKIKIWKVLLGFLFFPIIMLSLYYLLMLANAQVSFFEPEKGRDVYLIPEDFEGRFRVVYGENCGQETSVIMERNIVVVPANGIVILQSRFVYELNHTSYFSFSKSGVLKRLNDEYINTEIVRTNAPTVTKMDESYLEVSMVDTTNLNQYKVICYVDFSVDKKIQLKNEMREAQLKFELDSLTRQIVKACREKSEKFTPKI